MEQTQFSVGITRETKTPDESKLRSSFLFGALAEALTSIPGITCGRLMSNGCRPHPEPYAEMGGDNEV